MRFQFDISAKGYLLCKGVCYEHGFVSALAVEPTAGAQQKVAQSARLISIFLGGKKNLGRQTAKLA